MGESVADKLDEFMRPQREATMAALSDPQVGDRFHEWFSFWMHVVHVDGEYVAVVEAFPPCAVPAEGKLRHFANRAEFLKAYTYNAIEGSPLTLVERGSNVEGWYTGLLPAFPIPDEVERARRGQSAAPEETAGGAPAGLRSRIRALVADTERRRGLDEVEVLTAELMALVDDVFGAVAGDYRWRAAAASHAVCETTWIEAAQLLEAALHGTQEAPDA